VNKIYEEDDPNRLILGLGLGNALSALFGGIGGCGLIPNTLLNGRSGGEGYASEYAYAITLALAAGVFAPQIARIPTPALAGLMLSVASSTFEWEETKHLVVKAVKTMGRLWSSSSLFSPSSSSTSSPPSPSSSPLSTQPIFDFLSMLTTFLLCVNVDMVAGVFGGVVVSNIPNIFKRFRFRKGKPETTVVV